MPVENTLLIVAVVLLAVIAILLYRLSRRQQVAQYELSIDPRFTKQIADIGASVRHHADVSAVLKLMEQIEEHPGAIERLREYPESVRAAAWIHYVNCLGADLKVAQEALSTAHQSTRYYDSDKQRSIATAQQSVDSIRVKLDAAIAASGQKVGPRAV